LKPVDIVIESMFPWFCGLLVEWEKVIGRKVEKSFFIDTRLNLVLCTRLSLIRFSVPGPDYFQV
jgi:hypothetical protein